MMTLRLSTERGQANHGWLESYHSFSFANYYDPQHMGVSVLRVINDDKILPEYGFDTHPHRNMEIISYILTGAIEHKDSMGSRSILKAGEVQVMSAGTGVTHSEYNPSNSETTHLLQIWITPHTTDISPSYAQKDFSDTRGLRLIVSPDGRNGSLKIHQNALLYQLKLEQGEIEFPTQQDRTYYLHIAKGHLDVNGQTLSAGDAVTVRQESELKISSNHAVEALLFDLP